MTQQTFSVGKKPRLVITRGRGTITIRSWGEQNISVETQGAIAQLYQEGESVFVSGYETDLVVTIPYSKPEMKSGHFYMIVTNISISDHDGAVVAENVGNCELNNIRGNVELSRIEGNLQASNVQALQERKGIGGNAVLTSISRIEIGLVGANLTVQNAETVRTGPVGGSLEARGIAAVFQCGSVAGNCTLHDCGNAALQLSNVGGNLQIDRAGVASISSSNVGGNLTLATTFAPGSNTRLMAGGNATITLPEHANLRVYAMAGGSVVGEALGKRKSGTMLNVVYGNGAASLSVTAGGNVRLQGSAVPNEESGGMDFAPFREFGRDFGREMGKMGRDLESAFRSPVPPMPPMSPMPPMPPMPGRPTQGSSTSSREQPANQGPVTKTQKREAILRMVAEGRITPDEGNMLLEALEKE